jgi:hypothetical protein
MAATFWVIRYTKTLMESEVFQHVALAISLGQCENRMILQPGTYQGEKGPGVPFTSAKFFHSEITARRWLKRASYEDYADVLPVSVEEPQ